MSDFLTPEEIEEFRQLIKDECGLDMPHGQAGERANQLVMMYRMLMGPIPEDPEANRVPPQGGGVSPSPGDSLPVHARKGRRLSWDDEIHAAHS